MKKEKLILRSLIGVMFISIITYNVYLAFKGNQKFIKLEYNGIIQEIRIRENNHGLPDIKINNTWVMLKIQEEKITKYIHVGDSIVKESGSETIKIYRKNETNIWCVKEFK